MFQGFHHLEFDLKQFSHPSVGRNSPESRAGKTCRIGRASASVRIPRHRSTGLPWSAPPRHAAGICVAPGRQDAMIRDRSSSLACGIQPKSRHSPELPMRREMDNDPRPYRWITMGRRHSQGPSAKSLASRRTTRVARVLSLFGSRNRDGFETENRVGTFGLENHRPSGVIRTHSGSGYCRRPFPISGCLWEPAQELIAIGPNKCLNNKVIRPVRGGVGGLFTGVYTHLRDYTVGNYGIQLRSCAVSSWSVGRHTLRRHSHCLYLRSCSHRHRTCRAATDPAACRRRSRWLLVRISAAAVPLPATEPMVFPAKSSDINFPTVQYQ